MLQRESIDSFKFTIQELCGSLDGLIDKGLVNPDDYWASNETSCSRKVNPLGVTALGDRVTRLFIARLDYCALELSRILNRIHPEYRRAPRTEVVAQISEAKSKATAIRGQHTGKLNNFDEACVVLTQVYAGFTRHSDLFWLPNENLSNQHQADLLAQSILEPAVDLDAVDRVAWALSTVANELEQIPDPDQVIRYAASRYKLVVDFSAKTFFWKGEEFKEELSHSNWELFAVLLEARKCWNRPVDHLDLRRRDGSLEVLKVQKRRLVSSLKTVSYTHLTLPTKA